MKNSPCYNCTDRKTNCHSECFKYLLYKEDIAKAKEYLHKDDNFTDYKCRNRDKQRKRK